MEYIAWTEIKCEDDECECPQNWQPWSFADTVPQAVKAYERSMDEEEWGEHSMREMTGSIDELQERIEETNAAMFYQGFDSLQRRDEVMRQLTEDSSLGTVRREG